jgi:hypothetical protein
VRIRFPLFVYLRLAAHRMGVLLFLLMANGCDVTDNNGSGGAQSGDSIVVDFPVAYVERPLPVDEDGEPVVRDILDPAAFNPGARLVLKARATASAPEQILTDVLFPPDEDGNPALYDVKDLAISPDGRKLVFALRAPEIPNADDDEQPTWNIWEYDLDSTGLRQVIGDRIFIVGEEIPLNIFAEEGHDVAPQYLPDGRILFSSNRQERGRAILLNEGKPQYHGLDDKRQEEAFSLHVMDADGENRDQITFNASQDLQPTVLDNGDLMFLRRDGVGPHDRLSLYRVKPDGSDLELYYGYHTQDTGTEETPGVFAKPQELPDGRILVTLGPRETERLGGDLVAVNGLDFIAADQPTRANAGATGSGQESLVANDVDTRDGAISRGGEFSSAFPLFDGSDRLLVSWSQCRLIDPATQANAPCTDALITAGAEAADPLYGLWIYDTRDGTQLPVKIPEEGLMYTDAVVLAPRSVPSAWSPENVDPELVKEVVGVLHIRSVYDRDGLDAAPGGLAAISDPARTPTDNRERRFLRIVKNVPIPDDDVRDFDNSAFGVTAGQGMRDILGYVALEPDGSAKFKVPADVPFMVDLVDARGKRVGQRHQNWLQLRPGEFRECTGCHTADSELAHGRRDAEAASINPGAVGGVPFPNTLLRDQNGIPQANPTFGESMAEYYARIYGPRTPSMDVIFTDEWTNPANATPGVDISLRYVDINTSVNANPRDSRCAPLDLPAQIWEAPTACVDAGSWENKCRVTINYIAHIHPLWEADRRTCDVMGNVVENHTCTSCHNRGPADLIQIPAGQLELTGDLSQDRNDFLTSYAELMFQDNQQEVVENSLVDVVIEQPTGEFETDEDGNLILDENGQPIPIIELVTIPVAPAMSTAGARSSNRFFSRFEPGGTHTGYLSASELKLLAEWLDIGGQYYNNPFDAPLD